MSTSSQKVTTSSQKATINTIVAAGIAASIVLLASTAQAAPQAAPKRSKAKPGPTACVDLNKATAAQLTALKGIGPAKAGRTLEARAKSPFASLTGWQKRVKGVGPATVAKNTARICPLRARKARK